MRRLSSTLTTFYKVIFPAIWLSGFGVGTFAVLISSNVPKELHVIFPAAWLFGLLVCWFLCFPLKHVSILDGDLHVGGLRRTIIVPLSEVTAVTGSVMQNPESITLWLKHESAFGPKIKFMPELRFFRFSTHPTVTLLNDATGKG
jgi:hypothetical protein